MKDFIAALNKHSSITCVTREQYGKVDLEFPTFEEVLDFAGQVSRVVRGETVWPEIAPKDKEAWRQHHNMKKLIEIFTEYLRSDFQEIAMIAVETDESPHTEWRNRISWEFPSGPKAADFFQRLFWILGDDHELATP